ncbi:hypothetical protein [Nocardioides coralli]|uniref:hypothetical protein n=1 Tax=Nocardioides coralli TaxID=2872154 RepID=UPI001CA40EA1|nr:hypothetical protein [Nocardioides coralli]QZY28494.1 hypothetical protein K6T13_13625 [Nocardioides coralli]
MSTSTATPPPGVATEPRPRRLGLDPLVPLWLLAPVVTWIGHGFTNGVTRDVALYIQAGQAVADGEPPYVAVWNRAGPLAHLLPGLGVSLGRWVGAEDVTGARVLYFALAALTPVLVYVTVRTVFGSRLGGSVGAAAMVSFPLWAHFSTSGPDSKQPMVVFMALALMLVVQRRMLLAGVATALATLTWQPVLFALALAALVMGLTADGGWRGRVLALGRFALGGLATLTATVLYFVAAGALSDFLDGFWRANAGYTSQPPLLRHLPAVSAGMQHWFGWTLWLLLGGLVLSVVVALVVLVLRPVAGTPLADARAGAVATGAATVGAVAWSFYAFNAAPDSLLVLTVAAVGLGNGAALLAHAVSGWKVPRTALAVGVAGFVLAALVTTALEMVGTAKSTILGGRNQAEKVLSPLPEASVMTVGVPQPLALTGRRSISPYQLFSPAIQRWIDDTWPGGLTAYVSWVREQEAEVLFTVPGPMPQLFKPLEPDYVPVGRFHSWRAWLHVDVDKSTRRQVDEALSAKRRTRAQ